MARIPSYGQTTNGQCGFNQAASRPADPIKRHRARRERSHPKEVLTTQTCAVALDLLENGIQEFRTMGWSDFDPKRSFTLVGACGITASFAPSQLHRLLNPGSLSPRQIPAYRQALGQCGGWPLRLPRARRRFQQ